MGLRILQICAAPDDWVALFEDDNHQEMQIPVCAFALVEAKNGHRFISSISEDQGEGLGMPDCEAENWRGYRKRARKKPAGDPVVPYQQRNVNRR